MAHDIMKEKDFIGCSYGSLVAIQKLDTLSSNGTHHYLWLCKCGNKIIKTPDGARNLKNSCGYNCRFKNLIGQIFGKLVVIGKVPKKRNNTFLWKVQCSCGNISYASTSELKTQHKQSCGCLWLETMKNRIGPLNQSYKHGLSNNLRYKRKTYEDQNWIRKVKCRDNYTCQICGFNDKTVKGGLHAHHINSYINHPSQRCEIDNGITLCRWCHADFHSKYGINNANRQNFLEFLLIRNKIKTIISPILLDQMPALEKEYLDNI